MSKKKILVFIDWYLPGFRAGGPIRSCANLIAHLSDEFDFFVVTRDTDYMDSHPYSSVKKNEWNELHDGSSVFYISKENLKITTVRKIIREVNPDIIYLNGIYSFYFTIIPLLLIDKKKTKVIVAARGMLAPGAIAIKSLKKKIFLSLSKMSGLFNNVTFHATSEEEKKQIVDIFSKAHVCIAPNLPRKIYNSRNIKVNKLEGELRLFNIARIAPEKNLLFALEVLKNVKEKVEFDFFGPIYDNHYWEQCKKNIASLSSNIIVRYRGIAEGEQIFQLMKNYHFLFLPSRGENFGHIILEAMSAGLPVIISDQTPWKNLQEKKAGWALPLEKPNDFIAVIKKGIWMNRDEYEIYSKGAFAFASEYIHDEKKILMNKQLFL
jgi:glycosyltransferase involved in cell wall biosynthesis